MKLSIKHSPIGKPDVIDGQALTYGWQPVDWTPAQLIAHIEAGKPFAVAQFKSGHRKTKNFTASGIIAADIDKNAEGVPLTELEYRALIATPFIQKHAFAVIQSFNSQPGAYKCRVLFQLSETVTNAKEYAALVRIVLSNIPFADHAAKDAARAFLGGRPSRAADFSVRNILLDVELLRQEHAATEARNPKPKIIQLDFQSDNWQTSIQELEKRLRFNGEVNHEGWSQQFFACPMRTHEHDDTRPATQYHPEMQIAHCHKCGETFIAVELFEAYGIEQHKPLPIVSQKIEAHPHIRMITINECFVTDAMLPKDLGDTVLLISETGSGKTEWIVQQVKQGSVLVDGHRKTLLGQAAHRFGLDYYEDYQSEGVDLYLSDRLAITSNSLHKLMYRDNNGSWMLRTYEHVIIDEFSQGLAHLFGGTFNGLEGKIAEQHLGHLVSKAKQVFVADADISQVEIDWLLKYRGSLTIIKNEYRRQRGVMSILATKDDLTRHLKKTIKEADKPIAVFCDSKAEAKAITRMLEKRKVRVLCIHGDNSNYPEIAMLTNDIDAHLPAYRVLIYTSSLGTGIDIQTPVSAVYGVFLNQSIDTNEQFQGLERCRNADKFYIYTQEREGNRETDAKKLIRDVIANNADNARAFQITREFDENGYYQPDAHSMHFLRLWANIEARRNVLLNNPRTAFILKAKRSYEVQFIPRESPDKDKTMTEAGKEVKDGETTLMLTAPPIDQKTYKAAERSNMLGDVIRLGHERWKVEDFYGRDINDLLPSPEYTLLKEWESGGAARLNNFIDLFRPESDLVNRDIEETELNIPHFKRCLSSSKISIIKELLKPIFGSGLFHFEAIPKAELKQLLEHFDPLYEALDTDRTFMRRNCSDDPLARLRWVLSLVGMHFKLERVGKGKKRHFYRLNAERYRTMVNLAETRLTHTKERVNIRPLGSAKAS